MQGDMGSLVEGLPWFHDPLVEPDETYKAVRDGWLDLFCGHCGMMGKAGVWEIVKLLYDDMEYHGSPFRCPNCGEYRGQPVREREPQITWPERQGGPRYGIGRR